MKRLLLLGLLFPFPAFAHQPVMDMAPRWSGGSGVQLRLESSTADRLLSGDGRADNPLGLESSSRALWLEGVYTFHRSVRVTFKLPFHDVGRRFLQDGQVREGRATGVGDLIFTAPLKYYANELDHTWNLAFNPAVVLPTGNAKAEVPLGRGTVDYQFSVSLAREAPDTFLLTDLWTKLHTTGHDGKRKGAALGFDLNAGFAPYMNSSSELSIFLMGGMHLRHAWSDVLAAGETYRDSGGFEVEVAPIVVLLYSNVAFRVETSFPIVSVHGLTGAPREGARERAGPRARHGVRR